MTTIYYQHVITSSGALRRAMYSAGPSCATIELARQMRGDANACVERGERYAIVSRDELPGTWTDSAGNEHKRYAAPCVIEIL